MLVGDVGGRMDATVLALFTGRATSLSGTIYPLLVLSVLAFIFQRLAYGSSIAQLVPKQFLGHANGVVQMVGASRSCSSR